MREGESEVEERGGKKVGMKGMETSESFPPRINTFKASLDPKNHGT